MQLATTNTPTMTSMELVSLINELRDEGKAELRHDNFMVKIEKHPGIDSPKFLGHVEVPGPNGAMRKSKCYNLPKRECELMVMGESLAVQAKVYDRMTEMEQQLLQSAKGGATSAHASAIQPTKEFRALFGIARLIGLDKNAAAISANQAVTKLTGANVLNLLGHQHIEAENQVALHFTPTELGERISISGRKFNMLLAESGMQAKKGEHWIPLPAAEGFFRIMDTCKRQGDGTMIQQIKWADTVLKQIKKASD